MKSSMVTPIPLSLVAAVAIFEKPLAIEISRQHEVIEILPDDVGNERGHRATGCLPTLLRTFSRALAFLIPIVVDEQDQRGDAGKHRQGSHLAAGKRRPCWGERCALIGNPGRS